MTHEEKRKLYQQLSAPFTDEAIERTEGRITGKGYDTTGIKYIYVAARLNEVLGVGGYRTQQAIAVREVTTAKGRQAFDATCDITLQLGTWDGGTFMPWAEAFATGGHQSVNESDAKKGAYTNAFKKAAAMFGCGQQAYMGTLDDDNLPSEEVVHDHSPQRLQPMQEKPPPRVQVPTSAPKAQPTPTQQHYVDDQPQVAASPSSRNRLTSKQLSALWALARKLNYAQQDFRREVKNRYGVQPEFLDKNSASTIIGQLTARASNGHSHPAGEHGTEA